MIRNSSRKRSQPADLIGLFAEADSPWQRTDWQPAGSPASRKRAFRPRRNSFGRRALDSILTWPERHRFDHLDHFKTMLLVRITAIFMPPPISVELPGAGVFGDDPQPGLRVP